MQDAPGGVLITDCPFERPACNHAVMYVITLAGLRATPIVARWSRGDYTRPARVITPSTIFSLYVIFIYIFVAIYFLSSLALAFDMS